MSLSMYAATVPPLRSMLKNLSAVMAKAEAHCEAKKIDPNAFLTSRLYPDMLPFVSQIRIACDHAKSVAANMSGKEAPKHEDTETTMAELRARIAKCLAYLDTFTAADFERVKPDTMIRLPNRPGKAAQEYLYARQLPNFFFHVTTAYNLLRHGGVEIGKNDLLGTLGFVDV